MTDEVIRRFEDCGSDSSARNGQSAGAADNALGVDTLVYLEKGRWAVDISVLFRDGVVRHRIETYPTKKRAEISARLIKRAAERDLRGPLYG
ncbi:MAG TPA: hypothetical protein VJ757_09125 [Pseudonocardiaceae bacterium]|nr:hypothetical protein [Pseudonocardiaceae bacterium]